MSAASPRRSQSHSPRRSSRSSSKRRPLHERSDSQTNIRQLSPQRRSTDREDRENVDLFAKSPFPRLPSQVLRPKHQPYVFEDSTAGPNRVSPTTYEFPPLRRPDVSPGSEWPRRLNRTGSRLPLPFPNAPKLEPPPPRTASSRGSVSSSVSRVNSLKHMYEEISDAAAMSQIQLRKQRRSPRRKSPKGSKGVSPTRTKPTASFVAVEPTQLENAERPLSTDGQEVTSGSTEPSSPTIFELIPELAEEDEDEDEEEEAGLVRGNEADGVEDAGLAEEFIRDGTRDVREETIEDDVEMTEIDDQQLSRLPVIEPLHSNAPADDDEARPKSKGARSARSLSMGDAESVRLEPTPVHRNDRNGRPHPEIPERPRSASTPGAATDALIQALIDDGENVQYPTLRQPSAASLRTEASSIRTAYPPPLRLQRKGANPNLSQAATAGEKSSLHRLSNPRSSKIYRLRPAPSATSIATFTSFDTNAESFGFEYDPQLLGASDGWADELDDTVSELHSDAWKRQVNAQYGDSTAESRPVSRSTSRSTHSFYHFLNDSVAWARYYYRGEGNLRLMTPPQVTQVAHVAPETPEGPLESITSSEPSLSTPPVTGFPKQIYIPRRRPHNHEIRSVVFTETPVMPTITSVEKEKDVIPEAQETPRVTDSLAGPTLFNPTPELPHLSPSKRNSRRMPKWRTPSLDEKESMFSTVNRQTILFCIGFVFPLAWMVAAFLPLPKRPQWQNDMPSRPEVRQPCIDLFADKDVVTYQKARWWRNLNRFMSVAGIFIIAAIIACAVVATH